MVNKFEEPKPKLIPVKFSVRRKAKSKGLESSDPKSTVSTWNLLVNLVNTSTAFVKSILIANPRELYGDAYGENTPEELITDSKVAASLLTTANLLDFSFGQSILFLAFANLGLPLGFALSLIVNLGILKFKNGTGISAMRARPGSRFTQAVGFSGLLLLNILSSLAAGIGAELTLNQTGLADLKAKQIIAKAEEQANAGKPDSRLYDSAKKECDGLESRLKTLNPGDALFDPTYVRAHGMFRERSRVWNLKESGIPVCVKAKLLNEIFVKQDLEMRKDWQKTMITRNRIGNDVMFVKENFSTQYNQHFKTNEEMRSGVEAVELASINFVTKLAKGDFAGLGTSIFFASLSTITSLTACGVVFSFARIQQAKNSWSPAFALTLADELNGNTEESP